MEESCHEENDIVGELLKVNTSLEELSGNQMSLGELREIKTSMGGSFREPRRAWETFIISR